MWKRVLARPTEIVEGLTELEQAVLDKLLAGDHPTLAALREQTRWSKVSRRHYTGVGFWTDFDVPPDALAVLPANFDVCDVDARSQNLEHGAGFCLHVRRGYLSQLEGFTYDEPWPEQFGAVGLSYTEEPRQLHLGEMERQGHRDDFATVEPVFRSTFAEVWASGAEDPDALNRLSAADRAIYATRVLEGDIDNGGHYQAFGNGTDRLIESAIEGYDLLGLPEYAAHFRNVRAVGFKEDSPDELGTTLDDAYFRLSGSEAARAAIVRRRALRTR